MSQSYLNTPAAKLYNLSKLKTGRHFRFATEHMHLHRLCQWSPYLSYEIVGEMLPVASAFKVTYELASIIGIEEETQQPIYGDRHEVEIQMTENYPQQPAICKALTDIWHPNVKWHGKYKGRICANNKEFGKHFTIAELALGIGEMLQYKNYHALNTPPYPEDEKVAKWVREYAEPQGIIALSPPKVVDEKELKMPPDDWVSPDAEPDPDDPKGPTQLGILKIKDIRDNQQDRSSSSDQQDIRFKRKDP
ncbi:MAG: ubiquitin-conjugating enzyme E2 [Bacteroidota bacterium]